MTFQPDAFQPDAFQGEITACDPTFQADAFQQDAFQVCEMPLTQSGTGSLIGGARGSGRKISLAVGGGVVLRETVRGVGRAVLVGSASGTSRIRDAGRGDGEPDATGAGTQRDAGRGGAEIQSLSVTRAMDAGAAVLLVESKGLAVIRAADDETLGGLGFGTQLTVWTHSRDDDELLLLV